MKRNCNESVTKRARLPVFRPQPVAKLKKPRQLAVLFPVNWGRIDGVANFDLPGTGNVREVRVGDFSDLRKDIELASALALRDALNKGDKEAVARAVEQVAHHLLPSLDPASEITRKLGRRLAADSRELPEVAQHLLAHLVSFHLQQTRFVLWWRDAERQFVPAVYCSDERTALFAWALLGIVADASERLGTCPRCGTIFVGRSDQTYCSFKCAAAYRMARMRERKANAEVRGKAKR